MSERKAYTTKLDIELLTEIRELAQRKTKYQNDLIEAAIQDVLKKYKDQNRLEPSFTGLFLLQTLSKSTKQETQ
jgi:metal-responsive CopG/Arc/MetJ family transcriptional regulator